VLDVKAIREDPEPFRAGLARRNLASAVDELLAADERRRQLTTRVEELRAEQNRASKAIGGAAGDEKSALIAAVGKVSAELKELEPQLVDAEQALADLLAKVPNVPADSAPDGMTEEDAVEIKRVGEPPSFGFTASANVVTLNVAGARRSSRASNWGRNACGRFFRSTRWVLPNSFARSFFTLSPCRSCSVKGCVDCRREGAGSQVGQACPLVTHSFSDRGEV
jgi:seryl-tRNA synthetase